MTAGPNPIRGIHWGRPYPDLGDPRGPPLVPAPAALTVTSIGRGSGAWQPACACEDAPQRAERKGVSEQMNVDEAGQRPTARAAGGDRG